MVCYESIGLATLGGLSAHKWSVIFGGILKRSIGGITGIYRGLDDTVQTVFFLKSLVTWSK